MTRMRFNNRIKTPAVAVLVAVGACAGVSAAQNQTTTQPPDSSQPRARSYESYRSLDKMVGADLKSAADKDLGEVDDLIIDRGSGRILYAVVDPGWTEDSRVVRIDELRYDPAAKVWRTNLAESDLDTYLKFDDDRWTAVREGRDSDYFDTVVGNSRSWLGMDDTTRANNQRDENNTADRNENRKTVQIDGRVVGISRVAASTGYDQMWLSVRSDDDTLHRVSLGPSWYVSPQLNLSPIGDQVSIQAVDRGSADGLVATRVKSKNLDLNLRDDQGKGRWNTFGYGNNNANNMPGAGARWNAPLILASDLLGKDCRAVDDDCGEVDDAFVAADSNTVRFLQIDPDENFLGIADEPRIIPLVAASIGDDKVYILGTVDQITSAPTFDDPSQLNNDRVWDAAWNTFNVKRTDRGYDITERK